ncbi:Cysteine dioxygenase type 1 [Lamellibrachia satsuma]|nr:Cysteine dioxygenase type 1 [Lamellibrachia satsuma]
MSAEEYFNKRDVPAISNLDELIKELRDVFEYDEINVDYVKALLSSYKSNPEDWKKYANFETHRYTRNLVDTGNGKYNLIALCWSEGQASSIHSHSDSNCFVKMLDGKLKETRFVWPSESEPETSMQQLSTGVCSKDDVTYINDSQGLHCMENPSHSDTTVSLHLYIPPFSSCKTFDERTGHSVSVKMTFWSKYGERTKFTMSGQDSGDASTEICGPENN